MTHSSHNVPDLVEDQARLCPRDVMATAPCDDVVRAWHEGSELALQTRPHSFCDPADRPRRSFSKAVADDGERHPLERSGSELGPSLCFRSADVHLLPVELQRLDRAKLLAGGGPLVLRDEVLECLEGAAVVARVYAVDQHQTRHLARVPARVHEAEEAAV